MQYICGKEDLYLEVNTVVALGNFDGVHRGHQKLIEKALEEAQENQLAAVALSFYPHPTAVLSEIPKPLVMSRRDRKRKMEATGLDFFIEYPFTKSFAAITPEQFFEKILVEQLQAKIIVIGSNYFFGKNKAGDVQFLRKMGESRGIKICVVETVKENDVVISSTHIRQLIHDGEMAKASDLLGHPYAIVGSVVHGKKLGRTIGFPTANVIADPDRIYPPNGVYATIVKVYNKCYMGITNIGYNPTVGNTIKMVETHLFDFDEVIYGEEVEILFYEFIRPERKFESITELKHQIQHDKEKARFLLEDRLK